MCDVDTLKEQLVEIEKTNNQESTFESLPVEIILNICSYLDPSFLRNTFRRVCRRFEDILADEHYWRHWVHCKIKGCFPALLDTDLKENVQVGWEDVSVDMDVETRKWSNVQDNMKHIIVKDAHLTSVDAVLLINKAEICISGGRDRAVAVWDVSSIGAHDSSENTTTLKDTKPKHIKTDAHLGWVWDLATDDVDNASNIYSASWDNTVKAWDIETGLTCIETFKCGMSALSVVYCDKIVMTGLYSKRVLLFDLRAGSNHINSYKPHRGPVLSLHTFGNMVASVSEDKTLAVWDKVAGKIFANDIKIPIDKACPVCISWAPTALYIGDSKGSLHLMHPDKYLYIKSHEIWHEPETIKPSHKITSCYQSSGNLIVCSDRGEIKCFYNCYPPEEYTSIRTSTCDVIKMCYENGVMVVGTCESALEFWIPKSSILE